MRFILGAKPGDHKFLWVNNAPSVERREFTDEDNIRHEFRYLNGVASERYALRPQSELSLGEASKRQETTFLLGHGSAN